MSESTVQRVVQTHEGEIGVREFIIIAWQSRWLIVAITLLGVLLGLGSTFVLTKKYTATVLLSPVSNQSSSGLGALGGALSQLGGVASLAGLSLGSSNSARSEAIATLQSEALTTQYIQDNGLLPVLFSDKWDAAHSRWATKTGKAPSLWLGNALFESRVRSVTEEREIRPRVAYDHLVGPENGGRLGQWPRTAYQQLYAEQGDRRVPAATSHT